MYKYCLACLFPLQTPFDNFSLWRDTEKIISQCKWEIGQLTNVLNYLFDPNKTIYITESLITVLYLPTLDDGYTSVFVPTLDDGYTSVFIPTLDDNQFKYLVTIHIPASVYNNINQKNALIAVVEKIKLSGIKYQIISI